MTTHPILFMDSLQGLYWDPRNSVSELHAEEDAGTQVRSTKKTLLALHLPWETRELKKAAFATWETKAEAGSSEPRAARKGKAALLRAASFASCSSTTCFSFLGILPHLSKEGSLKWVSLSMHRGGKKSKQGFLCWFNKLAAFKKLKKSEPLRVASPSHSQQQHVVVPSNPPSASETALWSRERGLAMNIDSPVASLRGKW